MGEHSKKKSRLFFVQIPPEMAQFVAGIAIGEGLVRLTQQGVAWMIEIGKPKSAEKWAGERSIRLDVTEQELIAIIDALEEYGNGPMGRRERVQFLLRRFREIENAN